MIRLVAEGRSWLFLLMGPGLIGSLTLSAEPISGQQVPTGQEARILLVDSVAVEGNSRIQPQAVVGLFGIDQGDEISYRDVQRGIKRLMTSGQFRDVTVRAQGIDRFLLILEVEEEQWIRRVVIDGLESVPARTVQDTTNLRSGDALNRQRLLDAQTFIRDELAQEGIPFAEIEQRLIPVPGDENEVDVFIDVTEGQRVTVAQVEFSGNESVGDDDLRGAMGIKREGFWWFRGGSFNEIDYDSDLQSNIPALYRSQGFLDAEVVSDTVVVDPNTGKARLEITLEEGRQYRLNSFSVSGNSEFEEEEFSSLFTSGGGGVLSSLGLGGGAEAANVEGNVFDVEAFNGAIDQALEWYRNEGYLYAEINPVVTRLESEDDSLPMVDAAWEIQEGPLALINRVSIVGNDYTHEWVIRNQLTVIPGDVYSQDRLIRSYQSVSSLGFFETPMPFPDIQPTESGDVDITFEVAERSTGSINFGTSVGGGYGMTGFVGYEQPNLFGQAKAGSLRWDFGRFLNSFQMSYTDPALLQSLVSGTVTLFNSRDRFFQFTSGRRRRLGGDIRFGFPFRRSLFTRVFVGYGISRTDYELFTEEDDTSLFGRPPGVQSQLQLGVTRQTLDHPIFPTVGSRQNVAVELNGGIFGGDGDFTRVLGDGSWWVPVGQIGGDGVQGGMRFALGLELKAGAVFGDVGRFPFDRFWMGGVQFGEQLRGYDETSITPLGFYEERSRDILDIDRLGNAFFSLSVEYQFRMSDQLSLGVFYDAGNVYRGPIEFDPTRLYRGAGIGAALVTPFGPIGLDYAYGFDRRNPGWQLHFRMGGV